MIRIYGPTHCGMGSVTKATTSKPSRLAASPDLDNWGHDPQLLKTRRSSVTQGGHRLSYDAPGNLETMTKTMTDATLHRTADELSPWLQCCHSQHSSTMSDPAMMWPQEHKDSHARASTRRWHSLQAKLARTSLRLSTLRSGEPPLCNKP